MNFQLPNQPANPPLPSVFTLPQVLRYLHHIGLPPEVYPPSHDIEYLTLLHKHQIASIPYENLALHYSSTHRVNLDPQYLYEKMMKNGRGGFCMENCIFFRHILAALGFSVYTTGAKIRLRVNNVPQGPYIGWVHCVNIVMLPDGGRWMLDVSFGGDGPTQPMALVNCFTRRNLGTQEVRLIYSTIPGQSAAGRAIDPQGGRMWVYQYRNNEQQEWNSYYAFPEMEFLDGDLEWMAEGAMSKELSFQTRMVLGVRFIRKGAESSDQEIHMSSENYGLLDKENTSGGDIRGKIMLAGNVFKRNTGGKTELLRECKTESERIDGLKEFFGITLTDEEKQGIKGLETELQHCEKL